MNAELLAARPALEHCQAIVRQHAKSFYFCSHFLPTEKRWAMFAVYAVCRTLDDIVDEATGIDKATAINKATVIDKVVTVNPVAAIDKAEVVVTPARERPADFAASRAATNSARPATAASSAGAKQAAAQALAQWRQYLDDVYQGRAVTLPILQAMQAVLRVYAIPQRHFLDLIAGLEMDLHGYQYHTFEDLRLYCYRVAATVGLMGSAVFGYRDPAALAYAEALGIAMQLTNILRDVGEDYQLGRVYLPQEDLDRFHYPVADLQQGLINQQFIQLMQFEIARAREFYHQADAGINYLAPDSRLTVLAASRLYGGILQAIEKNGYDVFQRRASLSLAAKLWRLPQIWWESQRKFRQPA
jgi:15-cis-phytoene synthase